MSTTVNAAVSDLELDLRALTYFTQVDENLCCPICRSPLIDPQTTKCRHTFCADCIAGALEMSPTCPVDRGPLAFGDVSAAPIMIANLVNDLVVLCPNADLGCTVTQPRSLIKSHLHESCEYAPVDCPGCQEKIARRDTGKKCMHSEVECPHCATVVRELDMEHHEKICPQLSAPCKYCSAELPRSDISSHEVTCDEAEVRCAASSVGCPWTGHRREATEHAGSCAFTYLRPLLEEHSNRIMALEQENKTLRKKIDIIMPARTSDRGDSSNGQLDDQTIQILTEQEHLRSDLERLFAAVQDLDMKQSMMTMHMSDNMRTREEVAMIGAAVNNLRSQLHGLQLLTLHRQMGAAQPPTTAAGPSGPPMPGMLHVRRPSELGMGNDRVKL